jgi:hypothetical protein
LVGGGAYWQATPDFAALNPGYMQSYRVGTGLSPR